jgi:hypothetical protein
MMKTQLVLAAVSLFGVLWAQSGKVTTEKPLPEFKAAAVAPSPFGNEVNSIVAQFDEIKKAQEDRSSDLGELKSSLNATNDSVMQSISALSRQIGQMSGSYVSKESFVSLEQSVDELKKSVKNAGDDEVDPRLADLIRRVEALELRCGAVREVQSSGGGSTGSVKTTYQAPIDYGYSVRSTSSGGSTGSTVMRSYSTSTVPVVSSVMYSSPTVSVAVPQSVDRVRIVEPREPRRVSYAEIPSAPQYSVQSTGTCYIDENGNQVCPGNVSVQAGGVSVQASPRVMFPRLPRNR